MIGYGILAPYLENVEWSSLIRLSYAVDLALDTSTALASRRIQPSVDLHAYIIYTSALSTLS